MLADVLKSNNHKGFMKSSLVLFYFHKDAIISSLGKTHFLIGFSSKNQLSITSCEVLCLNL